MAAYQKKHSFRKSRSRRGFSKTVMRKLSRAVKRHGNRGKRWRTQREMIRDIDARLYSGNPE